jgi:hypothetical protein
LNEGICLYQYYPEQIAGICEGYVTRYNYKHAIS